VKSLVDALVVGGGIGGLATTLALARSGQTVHCLERGEDFAEIGAGLQFGPNASRALDQLGVLDDILPAAVRPGSAVLMDAVSGDVLTVLDLGPAFEKRYGYPYLVLHRHDLLEVLLQHCQEHELVTLETRRGVVDAEIGVESSRVTCEDASTYEAKYLIAADGLNSVLRPHVVDDEATCSGYAAYRGTMPMAEVSHAVAPDDIVLWIGPNIHLMQYPVRRSELYNQVAVFKSPRFAAGHEQHGQWGGPEELDGAFAHACEDVRKAVTHIGRSRHWAMYDRKPVSSWSTGSLLLMGDAAHPMLQYLGQGACQALEDAVELGSRFAADKDAPRVDFSRIRDEFERVRIPRASRCQSAARPWGELWHTQDPLLIATRNRLFAQRAHDDYSELDWLYADRSR
jgi:2-polyprenyl-6-methoxyphenol hydroxylase-like FAD-dependent oxidoreductase